MVVVEGCEVQKQPPHSLDPFEVGPVLVVVVVNPFYKKKNYLISKSDVQTKIARHIKISISTGLKTIKSYTDRRSDTNKIVTPRPRKRVDTWQPPRALKWDPVSQAPFKDSQGQK